ncbi:hypothetical protein BSZ35_14475 [Salinibacter sp. 10B]|nr:hypothetical protein BSZ35_14475 [Salinibacter sp. 10B]
MDGNSAFTVYAHLGSVDVQRGDSVPASGEIGEVGVSGNATRNPCRGGPPHVHIEMKPVNVDEENYNDDPPHQS